MFFIPPRPYLFDNQDVVSIFKNNQVDLTAEKISILT